MVIKIVPFSRPISENGHQHPRSDEKHSIENHVTNYTLPYKLSPWIHVTWISLDLFTQFTK